MRYAGKVSSETLSQKKKTPLFNLHAELKANFTDFAGWFLPLNYGSVIQEHLNTRQAASLFDTSHMGKIEVRGSHAQSFLQYLLTINLLSLPPQRCQYSLLCNEYGGTIDDLFVYCFNSQRYWLVVNAANTQKDISWLREHASRFSVSILDLTLLKAKIDLQGPLAEKIIRQFTPFPIYLLKRFDFVELKFFDIPVVISRSGYTAEDGFEIYTDWNYACELWQKLLDADSGLKPAGLGARDSLRIEACYPLYGHELTEDITPLEAGLSWVVQPKENFIGKEFLLKQKSNGIKRKLIIFQLQERLIPRPNYEIYFDGHKCGFVTSGCFSPIAKAPIGMGYVKNLELKPDDPIEIVIRNQKIKGVILKRPFYGYKRKEDFYG